MNHTPKPPAVACEPLLLRPILHERVWGGRALAKLGKALPPGVPIGESWELADLPASIPNGRSVVERGPFAGRILRDVIASHRQAILGETPSTPEGGFPLLIKYLDAQENLSVQVHPDAAYVAEHPEAHLKSEAWVVVDAAPGAAIYKGVKPSVDREAFRAAIESREVEACLNRVPVRAGDCHYLPSGTVHALGAGVVVAEVQTPSDTTFRVYDWGREWSTSPREMAVEPALSCMSFDPPPAACDDPHPLEADGLRTERLVRCEHFVIERITMMDSERFTIVTNGVPEVWMILHGEGNVPCETGESVTLERGRTVLIPAAMPETDVRLARGAVVLRVTLPSSVEKVIA
jgi:mannose-6-phosphate isomerase